MTLDVTTILLPLDGSLRARAAIPAAARVARSLDAAIELLTVHDPLEGKWEEVIDDVAESLEGSYQVRRVNVNVVGGGLPAEVIAGMSAEIPGTAICMATRGRSGLGGFLLGGVTREVIRNAKVPLLLVGPGHVPQPHDAPYPRVVAAIDGSAIAELALPAAARWAGLVGAPLHLLHVVERREEGSADPANPELRTWLAQLADTLSSATSEVTWEVAEAENPTEGIIDCAGRAPGGLVAMAAHGRSGMGKLLLGSVTETAIARSPAPILLLPPTNVVPGRTP